MNLAEVASDRGRRVSAEPYAHQLRSKGFARCTMELERRWREAPRREARLCLDGTKKGRSRVKSMTGSGPCGDGALC